MGSNTWDVGWLLIHKPNTRCVLKLQAEDKGFVERLKTLSSNKRTHPRERARVRGAARIRQPKLDGALHDVELFASMELYLKECFYSSLRYG